MFFLRIKIKKMTLQYRNFNGHLSNVIFNYNNFTLAAAHDASAMNVFVFVHVR